MKFMLLKKTAALATAFAVSLSMAIVLPEKAFWGITANAESRISYDGRLSLGDIHSAYIDDLGDLYLWGANSNGAIGDGTSSTRYIV